jgi:hypothetical protein
MTHQLLAAAKIRRVGDGRHLTAQIGIASVFDDADDLVLGFGIIRLADSAEVLPQRVLAGKELLDEPLIDDGDFGGLFGIEKWRCSLRCRGPA